VDAEEAVQELIDKLVAAWNGRDMRAFASLFAEDADYISGTGQWLKGRQTIERELSNILASTGEHSDVAITGTWIKFLKGDVALVHNRWEMASGAPSRDGSPPARKGIFMQVLIFQDGNWRIAALQNTDAEGDGLRNSDCGLRI
jgi:uncharacterized protein (TIGR02246 family)